MAISGHLRRLTPHFRRPWTSCVQPRLPARPRTSARAARVAVSGHYWEPFRGTTSSQPVSRACARIADPSAGAAARQFSGSPRRPGSAGMPLSIRCPIAWSLLGRRRPRQSHRRTACSAAQDVALHLVLDRPASDAALLLVHRGRSDNCEDPRFPVPGFRPQQAPWCDPGESSVSRKAQLRAQGAGVLLAGESSSATAVRRP
jgi:hypothetical protein